MTDLHTHILPKMDDGAQSTEISLQMLRREFDDGVDTVALTPHFYRNTEHTSDFLSRRRCSYEHLMNVIHSLPSTEQARLPHIILGAEVSWFADLVQMPDLDKLCYADTRFLLVEPPFCPWDDGFFNQMYDLMNCTGITPVIAHVDRYWSIERESQLDALFSLHVPVQLSAEALLHFSTRRRALRLIDAGKVQMIVSDAHNMTERPPKMKQAYEVMRRKHINSAVFDKLMPCNDLT